MTQSAGDLPNLCGLTVLIAEPNPLIALDLAATLGGWGARPSLYYDLTGPEQSSALDLVCAALVDVPSNHEPLSELIAALRRRGVPTVLTTACGADSIGGQFPEMKVFDKPVDYAALAQWFGGAAAPFEGTGETCTG